MEVKRPRLKCGAPLQQTGSGCEAQLESVAESSPEQPVTECTAAASPDEALGSIAVRLQVSEEPERPVRLRLAASEAEAAALPPGVVVEALVGSQSAAEPLHGAEAFGAPAYPAAPAAAAQAVDASAPAKQSAPSQHDDWLSDLPAAPSSPVIIRPAALAAGGELSYAELTAQLAGVGSSSSAPHSAAKGAL